MREEVRASERRGDVGGEEKEEAVVNEPWREGETKGSCAEGKVRQRGGLCSGERARPGQKGPGIRAKVCTTRGRLGRNDASGGVKRLKRKMGLHRAHTRAHIHTDRW